MRSWREAGVVDAFDAVRDGACHRGSVWPMVTRLSSFTAPRTSRRTSAAIRAACWQALGVLEEDPTQLEALLKLTEKVISTRTTWCGRTPVRPDDGAQW